jgi:glycosyltransferase involved in cell wall biosynthesis
MYPKVSVVLATLGRETVLEVLRSIFSQTVPVYEVIICLDDPSKETFMRSNITLEFGFDRITLLINRKNLGVSASYNFAISHISGDLIAVASDDDPWFKHKIEVQLEDMRRKNMQVVSITSCLFSSDVNSAKVRPKSPLVLNESPLEWVYGYKPGPATAARYLPMSSALFPANLKSLTFDESMNSREDLLWLQEAYFMGYPVYQSQYPGVRVWSSHERSSNRDNFAGDGFLETLESLKTGLGKLFLLHHLSRSAIAMGGFRSYVRLILQVKNRYTIRLSDFPTIFWQLSACLFFLIRRKLFRNL